MDEKLKSVLADRGATYGDFGDIALEAQARRSIDAERLTRNASFRALSSAGQATVLEALGMIEHKIARALMGDVSHADTWLDIAGYATLIHDRITSGEK